MAQYIAAKSIMENHGPTLPSVTASDLSSPMYLPLRNFPEGYSYLIAIVWTVSNNLYFAVIFWQWISILVYILAFGLIFQVLKAELDSSVIPAFLLIIAFSLSPWLYYKPTDLMAISFYWLGLALFVSGIESKAIVFPLVSGILFSLCMTLRYAYQPIMPVSVTILLLVGIFLKNRKVIVSAIYTLASTLLGWIIFVLHFKSPGSLPSEAQSKKIYWENLLSADWTIFNKPLFDDRILHSVFFGWGGETGVTLSQTLVSLLILVTIITLLVIHFKSKKLFNSTPKILLITTGISTALAAVGLLYLLSALSKPQENDYLHTWTYVRETRYYALLFVIVLLLALIFAFEKGRTAQWFRIFIWGLIIISIPYYILAKCRSIKSDPDYFHAGKTKIMFGESKSPILPELEKHISESNLNGIPPVYLTANRTIRYAQLIGARVLFPNFSQLSTSNTSHPVALLIHFSNQDPYNKKELQSFIQQHPPETLFLSPSDTLYRIVVQP
jgi:hypothetical protein